MTDAQPRLTEGLKKAMDALNQIGLDLRDIITDPDIDTWIANNIPNPEAFYATLFVFGESSQANYRLLYTLFTFAGNLGDIPNTFAGLDLPDVED